MARSRKRGRPKKFFEASRVVALTLPETVIRGLRDVHPDLARAIVALFQRRAPHAAPPRANAELVAIGERHSLIVVSRKMLAKVPGVRAVPLELDRAFLALGSGRGIADLELAVIDRLGDIREGSREWAGLMELRTRLREWRHSRTLRFHGESIIVVEHLGRPRARHEKR